VRLESATRWAPTHLTLRSRPRTAVSSCWTSRLTLAAHGGSDGTRWPWARSTLFRPLSPTPAPQPAAVHIRV